MADQDHLDRETSISAALTETGLEAKAKSRFVAAVDRLAGNVLDAANAFIEAGTSLRRAKTEGERRLIEATAKYGVDRLGQDEQFASRAFDTHFRKIAREQVNKDAVLTEALEDLRNHPSVATDNNMELSDQFLDRFERYAAEASTDELRERWGRILASEVRQPGTFSAKVLRVVDELEAETAQLFERVCANRLTQTLPKCLVGELSFADTARLTTADLIVEPGLGQRKQYFAGANNKGEPLWIMALDQFALAFSTTENVPKDRASGSVAVFSDGSVPVMPVYVLTEVGVAICSILPDNSKSAFDRYVKEVRQTLPNADLFVYAKKDGADDYALEDILPGQGREANLGASDSL